MKIENAALIALASLMLAACTLLEDGTANPIERELEGILALLPGQYAGEAPNPRMAEQLTTLYHTLQQVTEPSLGELVFHHVISVKGFDDDKPLQQKLYLRSIP